MIRELKELVKKSSEDEVRSLLFYILCKISMGEETQYSEEQLAKDLKKTYKDFLNYKSEQNSLENEKDYKAIHIIFDDAASGSLKAVLKEMELQNDEKVISFSDLFSIGPIWKLNEKRGLSQRYNWLKNHINFDDESYIDEYQADFNKTTLKINAIPENRPIIIWTGENSHEQTAVRFVLYLLKDKTNDIFLIESTKIYKIQFDIPDTEIFPLHTGEMSHERLRPIYEKNRTAHQLSQEERKQFEEEWEELSNKQEVLRIWKNGEIHSVEESFYDDYIINSAKKLQSEHEYKEFMKSASVIGEVIGNINQFMGDIYIEYRLRHLILKGVFEIEGIPKGMRYYSVKLR